MPLRRSLPITRLSLLRSGGRGGASSVVSSMVLFRSAAAYSTSAAFGAATRPLLQRTGGTVSNKRSSTSSDSSSAAAAEASSSSSDDSSSAGGRSAPFSAANEAAAEHAQSLSGVPSHKGTMAAFATMRLRRIANAEAIEADRTEMMSELAADAEDPKKVIPEPSDDEVKAWRAAKTKRELEASTRRQRMARDAFVREILGPAPPRAASASTSTSSESSSSQTRRTINDPSSGKKTRYVLHGSDGSVDGGINTGTWTPKDGVAPSAAAPAPGASSDASNANGDANKKKKPAVALNSQEGMHPLNFPEEETSERLNEAAAKYQTTNLTSYGVGEMQHSGRKLMLRLAIASIFLLLIPALVDPDGKLGEGGADTATMEAIRLQQGENVRAALTEQKREAVREQMLKRRSSSSSGAEGVSGAGEEGEEGDDEDNFYGSSSSGTVGTVEPSALTNFNPVMRLFGVVNYYYLVAISARSGRDANDALADRPHIRARREQAKELFGSMKYGVEANRPENERRD